MIGGGEVVKVSLKTSEAAVKKREIIIFTLFQNVQMLERELADVPLSL